MLRRWMLGGLCGLLVASVCHAQPGIVKTRDGQTFEGEVIEHDDEIIVERKGIRTTIPRADVRSVSLSNSVEQEYGRRLAKLNAYDIRGRIELAQWVFQNKAYGLALEVLNEAQRLQPRNQEVADMIRVVNGQMYLDQREARKRAPVQLASREMAPPAGAAAPAATAPSSRAASTRPTTQRATRVLTADEMNTVRQEEWQGEPNVRVTFKNDVRKLFVAQQNVTPAEFNRHTPAEQAWAILQNGTPEMKKNVVVLNDPPSLVQFRQVQTSLLSACVTCHTADKTSSNFALRWPAASDVDRYTNFVILQKYSYKAGERTYSMIDRVRPEDSVLLQFSLPPMAGVPAHPNAANYRGVVKGLAEARTARVGEWIGRLKTPAPDYTSMDLSGPADAPRTPPRGGK